MKQTDPGFSRRALFLLSMIVLHSGINHLCWCQARAVDRAKVSNGNSSFDGTKLKKITDLLQSNVEAKTIAGGVAVVAEKGEMVYFEAVGDQDVAASAPMQKDTLFRIASMTKPITSTAILMLRDEGKLKLSDPVSKYLPEFRAPRVFVRGDKDQGDSAGSQSVAARREITIHDLLTHTSGITYRFFGQEPFSTLYEKAGVSDGLIETPWTTAENIKRLAGLPLTHQPGEAWQYGLSSDVLGRIVEVVSEKSLDRFFRERIFEPLQMNDTHFFVPEGKIPRLAALYRPQEDKTIREVGDAPQSLDGLEWSSTYHWKGPKTYHSGGAGLVSTAGDYLRFLQMLLDGGTAGGRRLLSKKSVQAMTTNQIGGLDILFKVHGDKFGYGFGIASQELPTGAPAGTYSWGGIFHTFFWVDPENEIIGIVMTQLYPFDHSTLWADFQRLVYEAMSTNNAKQKALGPKPGDVYREFSVHNGGNRDWRVTDPQATAPGAKEFLPNPVLKIPLSQLEGATRAEAVLDRWGGHLKTTQKRIRFNGQAWIDVPELRTTPKRAELYYSQDNPIVEIPLEHLKEGENTFEGTCSTIDGYNWGQWGLYSLIVRLYYDPKMIGDRDRARIGSPKPGEAFTDNPEISVEVGEPANLSRVDVLAWYDGYDENGDGIFQDWHGANFQPRRGEPAEIAEHAGTAKDFPFSLRWDTTWVPDQPTKSIKLVARVRQKDGLWFVTDSIEGLTLKRTSHRIALYPSKQIPERFGVRAGGKKSCKILIPPSDDLSKAVAAVLPLRTWHGWDGHHHPLKLNGSVLPIEGKNHHYDLDRLKVPVKSLRNGDNVFEISSETDHHMLEVLWPGPALLVRYEFSEQTSETKTDSRVPSELVKQYEQFALTHDGDPSRGKAIFENEKHSKCLLCHKLEGHGGESGPDLSRIGGKFDRAHLIESLLEPSRQIVEGYRSTTFLLRDGRVIVGIIKERGDKALTVVDANNKQYTIPTDQIETQHDSSVSLMPEGLAENWKREEFTDLVAYLETLRSGANTKFGAGIRGGIELPPGFSIQTIATGLSGGVALETTADGRVFVCEQQGRLRLIENDQLQETPFAIFPVDSEWERGLIGVTVHPDFPRTPYVFVCYVAKEPYPHHRLSRLTAQGNIAKPGSELILLRGDDQRKLGGKVPAGHQGGAVHFGKDGKLYLAVGEQTAETPSQSLDSFQGKMLRINADGSIPSDNPFFQKAQSKYRAIWARGLRNPFTFAIHPQTGLMLINDVGGKFEEINVGQAGGNYGWPLADHGPHDGDQFLDPIHWYPQASIAGGDFVPDSSNWPPEYTGHYLFADFVHGEIRSIDPKKPRKSQTLVSALRRPVDLRFASDGSLYVLLRNAWVIDGKFEPGTSSLMKIVPPQAQ